MLCPICKNEVVKYTTFLKDGKMVTGCRYCLTEKPTPILDHRIIDYSSYRDSKGEQIPVGVGHLKDIRARKRDSESGKIYRDVSRKYFT